MLSAIYVCLVIFVALWAAADGFRKAMTRQLARLLGFAFGVVGARVLTPHIPEYFEWVRPWSQAPEFAEISVNLVCAVAIYCCFYALFSLISPLLNRALAVVYVGIFNRIAGAFFSLVKNLMWLSIALNLLLCFSPKSGLLVYEKANDGNPVAAVMALAPGLLGCYGAEDFALFNQLKQAKTISCNFTPPSSVILLASLPEGDLNP